MNTFEDFYNTHRRRLFSYLLKMSGDPEVAADILQESFARYLGRYGGREAKVAVLYRIARNAFLDEQKKRQRNENMEHEPTDKGANQEHTTIVREEFWQMQQALEKLAKDEKDILLLAVSGDLKYQEIADILAISVQNVKVKVHRARVKLRNLLSA